MTPANRILLTRILSALLLTGLAGSRAWGAGTPPVLVPGTCVYLVGAPAGAPAAPTEATSQGTFVQDVCAALIEHVGTGETGPNSVQAVIQNPPHTPYNTSCEVSAWTAHDFVVAAGGGPVDGHVDVSGAAAGIMLLASAAGLSDEGVADIDAELLDTGSDGSGVALMARASVFHEALLNGTRQLAPAFSQRLEARFWPGHGYRLRLVLSVSVSSIAATCSDDFGLPGSGNGAHYDSIEVCLEAPAADPAVLASLQAAADEDIETHLYARQCVPTIWMPAAQGGRLERARGLVGTLVSDAVATGDPGVNTRVATERLMSADAQISSGQYQRACRSLVDAIHAITTP